MVPFHAKSPLQPNPDPHVMPTTLVSIYSGEQHVGSYVRTYGAYGASTFCPFEQDGRWYALYSSDYTTTRLMPLPDCRDLGGELPSPGGFCPVEYYVPRYRMVSWQNSKTGKTYEDYEIDSADRFGRSSETEDPEN